MKKYLEPQIEFKCFEEANLPILASGDGWAEDPFKIV